MLTARVLQWRNDTYFEAKVHKIYRDENLGTWGFLYSNDGVLRGHYATWILDRWVDGQ